MKSRQKSALIIFEMLNLVFALSFSSETLYTWVVGPVMYCFSGGYWGNPNSSGVQCFLRVCRGGWTQLLQLLIKFKVLDCDCYMWAASSAATRTTVAPDLKWPPPLFKGLQLVGTSPVFVDLAITLIGHDNILLTNMWEWWNIDKNNTSS